MGARKGLNYMTRSLRIFQPFTQLQSRSFEQMFHEFFDDTWLKEFNRVFEGYPVSNVFLCSKENRFEIEIAVPGFKKDEIQIEADSNILTITAKHKEEIVENDEDKIRLHKRLKYEDFVRSYRLPLKCDLTKINADLNDGILRIYVPFDEKQKQKNLIEIK